MFDLREYQQDFVARLRDAYRRSSRVLGVSPTGSGKTVAFAYITHNAAQKGNRVIIAAHRTEIVGQISEALDKMDVKHGRIQPGHKPTGDLVQVAMIQTLANRADRIEAPDFLIIDESHHCVSKSYDAICNRWPDAKLLGVTATPKRLDGKGLGRIFETMVEGPTTAELIQAKWLAGYIYLAPPPKADISRVATRAGDYATDQLAEAMDKAVVTGDAVQHYRDHLMPRSAICFCVRVDHAEHVAQQFRDAGIRAVSVDGTMDRETRRDRIEGLGTGKYQVLTSCALISEGLDVPSVGGVILLRPTKSLALHLQQIGRSLRPKPDGSRAVILDHVGNVRRHGMPDAPRKWTLEDKKADPAPTTQCHVCYRVFDRHPAWKQEMLESINCGEEADCNEPEHPECLLHGGEASAGGGGVTAPVTVSGSLQVITDTPAWAQGCSIMLARGHEFKVLLDLADTREKLEEIRRARGYHPMWTRRVLESRRRAA